MATKDTETAYVVVKFAVNTDSWNTAYGPEGDTRAEIRERFADRDVMENIVESVRAGWLALDEHTDVTAQPLTTRVVDIARDLLDQPQYTHPEYTRAVTEFAARILDLTEGDRDDLTTRILAGREAPARITVDITREQLESWARRPLTDHEVSRLDDCIPDSTIPDAVADITSTF